MVVVLNCILNILNYNLLECNVDISYAIRTVTIIDFLYTKLYFSNTIFNIQIFNSTFFSITLIIYILCI